MASRPDLAIWQAMTQGYAQYVGACHVMTKRLHTKQKQKKKGNI
jgi:hypothetical protein